MHLVDLVSRDPRPAAWAEGDNIPWNDPAFSERMLREHLSQDHDLASRRLATIDRQVDWIHRHLTNNFRVLEACRDAAIDHPLYKRGGES